MARKSVEIIADIAKLGPMLPGSVRRTKTKVRRNGKVFVYDAQPIYTTWDPAKKRQVSKRIPTECFDAVSRMTKERGRLDELLKELDAALVKENLPAGDVAKKKTSSRRAQAIPRR